jgi:NAD(P)-dependent dehydrogenase (short-subunit alcohol dehydrogenase family)
MQRTVLTTGANSGIGLATVLAAAHAGFRSVGSVRSKAKGEQVASAAKQAGVQVETVVLEVTDAPACARVIDAVRPHALVNNAGIGATGAVEDVDDDEARHVLETMVVAPMRLSRLALRHMRRRREGRIINLSSIYGLTTTPLTGWYQGAKHALEALSDALRVEVGSAGIHVILVEPGGFKTAIWAGNEQAMRQRRGSRYHTAYRRTVSGMQLAQSLMGDPATVAAIIIKALTARYPRARYLVGYDAQMLALTERLVPTLIKDAVSRLTLGL